MQIYGDFFSGFLPRKLCLVWGGVLFDDPCPPVLFIYNPPPGTNLRCLSPSANWRKMFGGDKASKGFFLNGKRLFFFGTKTGADKFY